MTPNDLHDMIESVTNSTWTQDDTDPYMFYYIDPDPNFYKKLEALPIEVYKTIIKDKITLLVAVYSEVGYD